MKHTEYRENALREHRVIALFCVMQCWIQNLDGIILHRSELKRLLDIEKFEKSRQNWIIQDFKYFFPFCEIEEEAYEMPNGYTNENQMQFSRLTVSRVALDKNPRINSLQLWILPTHQELEKLCDFVPFFTECDTYDNRLLALYLELLAQGQISPKSIPPLSERYKEAEQAVEKLLPVLGCKLVNDHSSIISKIENYNLFIWGYDSYNELNVWFNGDKKIHFSVELILGGDRHINKTSYRKSIITKVKGELSQINQNWQIEGYEEVLEID